MVGVPTTNISVISYVIFWSYETIQISTVVGYLISVISS